MCLLLCNDKMSLYFCRSMWMVSTWVQLVKEAVLVNLLSSMAHQEPWQCVLYPSALETLRVEALYKSTSFIFYPVPPWNKRYWYEVLQAGWPSWCQPAQIYYFCIHSDSYMGLGFTHFVQVLWCNCSIILKPENVFNLNLQTHYFIHVRQWQDNKMLHR